MDDNKYEVVLESFDTTKTGKFHLNIEKVALNNFKVFENGIDYKANPLTFNVLKNVPTIENIVLSDNNNEKTISATYEFVDHDATISKLTAVLVDSTKKIVKEEEIPLTEIGKKLTLSYEGNTDGFYKLKFLADYNLGTDRHNYTDKNIGEKEILTQTEIQVLKVEYVNNNMFPVKKMPKYTIKYTIKVSDNLKGKYNEFAGITINGANYDGASGNTDGNYTSTISFIVPSESGIVDLNVSRVKLRKETYQGYTQQYFSDEIKQKRTGKHGCSFKNLQSISLRYF